MYMSKKFELIKIYYNGTNNFFYMIQNKIHFYIYA